MQAQTYNFSLAASLMAYEHRQCGIICLLVRMHMDDIGYIQDIPLDFGNLEL